MANESWTYTNSALATKTLTFATAAPLMEGSGETIDLNEVTERTKDGALITKKYGDELYYHQYSFIVPEASDTESDYADFKEFIGSTYVYGSKNSFTWTDYGGTARTVRLMGVQQVANEWIKGSMHKKITVTLQEVS